MTDTAPAGATGTNANQRGARNRGHREDHAARTAASAAVRHSERLYVPWFHWLLPLLAAGLLAAEIHMGYAGVRAWLPYVVLMPLTAFLVFRMGRARVRVTAPTATDDGELWVGDAHLPLHFVGNVEVLSASEKRAALGRDLDPTAFVLHRGWVSTAVRVQLTDPADPTPYWVFSTRSPERLAELLRGGAEPHAGSPQPGT